MIILMDKISFEIVPMSNTNSNQPKCLEVCSYLSADSKQTYYVLTPRSFIFIFQFLKFGQITLSFFYLCSQFQSPFLFIELNNISLYLLKLCNLSKHLFFC